MDKRSVLSELLKQVEEMKQVDRFRDIHQKTMTALIRLTKAMEEMNVDELPKELKAAIDHVLLTQAEYHLTVMEIANK